jgi:hypothetical protein
MQTADASALVLCIAVCLHAMPVLAPFTAVELCYAGECSADNACRPWTCIGLPDVCRNRGTSSQPDLHMCCLPGVQMRLDWPGTTARLTAHVPAQIDDKNCAGIN